LVVSEQIQSRRWSPAIGRRQERIWTVSGQNNGEKQNFVVQLSQIHNPPNRKTSFGGIYVIIVI